MRPGEVQRITSSLVSRQVIKRLVVHSLDYAQPQQELARQLISRLYADSILTVEQLALGCKRLLEALPDLRLDNPRAAEILADFIDSACKMGGLPEVPSWQAAISILRSASCDDEDLLAVVNTSDAS